MIRFSTHSDARCNDSRRTIVLCRGWRGVFIFFHSICYWISRRLRKRSRRTTIWLERNKLKFNSFWCKKSMLTLLWKKKSWSTSWQNSMLSGAQPFTTPQISSVSSKRERLQIKNKKKEPPSKRHHRLRRDELVLVSIGQCWSVLVSVGQLLNY